MFFSQIDGNLHIWLTHCYQHVPLQHDSIKRVRKQCLRIEIFRQHFILRQPLHEKIHQIAWLSSNRIVILDSLVEIPVNVVWFISFLQKPIKKWYRGCDYQYGCQCFGVVGHFRRHLRHYIMDISYLKIWKKQKVGWSMLAETNQNFTQWKQKNMPNLPNCRLSW